MERQRDKVRLEESRQELDLLESEFLAWLKDREDADTYWRYQTQLASLRAVVCESVCAVREELEVIEREATSSGELYERCRESDGRMLFVRRFWAYYREKWDQRDDPDLEPLLSAAEEVVWSCYAGAFEAAGEPIGPAPLPYLDPEFSPHAVPRVRPPSEIKTTDDLLKDTLARLPVPVTGLPPICLRRPWWLGLLAHETGHHVQYDLGGGALLDRVREIVVAAAGGEDADRGWRSWGQELFADAFALGSIGPSYLWLLDELELATDDQMRADAGTYPPRAARRFFAAHVLAALQKAEPAMVQPLAANGDGPADLRLAGIAASVPEVARALVDEPLHGNAALRVLSGWKPAWFADEGTVSHWRKSLPKASPLVADARRESARLAIAGAVTAWREVAAQPEAGAREDGRDHLAGRAVRLIADSHPTETRARVTEAPQTVESLATRVAKQLRQVTVEVA